MATRDGAGHGNFSSLSFKIGPRLKIRLICFPGIAHNAQIKAAHTHLMKHKGRIGGNVLIVPAYNSDDTNK